jgi:hypothetical protein
MASMRSFLSDRGSLWGGGVRVSEERFSRLSWSGDFIYEAGTLHAEDRDYTVRSGTFGGWLMLYTRNRFLTARLGAGLRMGVVASPSEDPDGDSDSALVPWGWPLAATSLTIANGPVALEFSAEGGYTALPIGGATGRSVRGGWVSVQFGIGFWR